MTVPITESERIVISRQGENNAVQYQKKYPDGWKTETRKVFEGSWKGNIVEEMKGAYLIEQKRQVYADSKLKHYH